MGLGGRLKNLLVGLVHSYGNKSTSKLEFKDFHSFNLVNAC